MKYLINFVCVYLFLVQFSFGAEYKKDFNHLFDVQKGVTVILKNGDGNVQVDTWDRDQVKVDVLYHANSSDKGQEFEVEFSQKNNMVYIIGHEYKQEFNGFFSYYYVDYVYKITVPSYAGLEIRGNDGNVEINGVQGDIECRIDDGNINLNHIKNDINTLETQDGDIIVEDLQGDLSIRCGDGDVTVENAAAKQTEISVGDGRVKVFDCKSDFYVDSDDGDISLIQVAGKELDVNTNDGDVDIVFTGSGDVNISVKGNDGRVDMTFDNPVSAAFTVETNDGHIRVDADNISVFKENEHLMKGELGKGDGKVFVRTQDGSVSINSKY